MLHRVVLPRLLRRMILGGAAALVVFSAANVRADAIDEHIMQACGGASADFFVDPLDEKILTRLMDNDLATLYVRAKITGAAHACGEQTDGVLKKLQQSAVLKFNGNAELSARFSQVLACTEARFERLELQANWAATARSCPQAKSNFAFYVRSEQPISPNNPAPQVPLAPDLSFAKKCESAGVHFFKKPAEKVKSIAFDWSSDIRRTPKTRYELDAFKRIVMIGSSSWTPTVSSYTDFIEKKFDPTQFGMGTATPKYVRVPKEGKFFGVETLSADAVVRIEVSDPKELDEPVLKEHLLRYTLTVSDRRTNEKLGTMVYWIDMVNRVACGANVKNAIDQDVFILQAADIPIVIPPYEVERRKGAWIKDSHEWEPDASAR